MSLERFNPDEIRIAIEEIVFDNIDHQGANKEEWLQNLTSPTIELGLGSFKILEKDF